jgi:hypothetical protein
MSFLDLQDLAFAIAQSGIGTMISSCCADFDGAVDALEAGVGACLITLAVRQRAKH